MNINALFYLCGCSFAFLLKNNFLVWLDYLIFNFYYGSRESVMSNKALLSTALMAALGLAGCQTISGNETPANNSQTNNVVWQKTGEVFDPKGNEMLKANESRLVFFRQDDNAAQSSPVVVKVSDDNLFQVSLDNNYYSDIVVCNGSQIVTAQNMHPVNGQVLAQSEQFSFAPQATTYLQVGLLDTGAPAIQQLSANQAVSMLENSKRGTHQVSRVFIECDAPKPVVTPPVVVSPVQPTVEPPAQNTPIRNERLFTVLFDFDSTNITTETASDLGLMAEFIRTRDTKNIVLEGHTDSEGSESYNVKLSQERANLAKDVLVNNYGIEGTELSAIGYGESRPVDTNKTEQGRQNNRRVVATVVSEQ